MDEILNGRTVLVVDDTAVSRMLVADILTGGGSAILEAESGEQALQRAKENAIDAFLLDIRLPDMNGIELCRELRGMDRYKGAPIIFVTAIDQREVLQWALEAGADDFIQKPPHAMVLRRRLGNLLQKAAYIRQVESMSRSRPAPSPLIAVRDVPASSRWYQQLLKCRSGHGGAEYEQLINDTGAMVLQLHAWDAHEHPHLGDPESKPHGSGVLLWFQVGDFGEAVARANAMPVQVLEGPKVNRNANHREIWMRDPDGYVVVLAGPHGDV